MYSTNSINQLQICHMKLLYLTIFLFSFPLKAVENLFPAEEYSPIWASEHITIAVDHYCHIDKSKFIPTIECYEPYMRIQNSSPDRYQMRRSLMSGEPLTVSIKHDDLTITNLYNEKHAIQLFLALANKENPQLLIKTIDYKSNPKSKKKYPLKERIENSRIVVLSDFKETSDRFIKGSESYYESELQELIINRVLILISTILFLVFIIWIFLTKIIPAMNKAKNKVKEKISSAKDGVESNRIRKVAEDEAVRTVIRNEINNASSDEIEVLKVQIKAALDASDMKTATHLISLLNKTDKNN